MLGKIPIDAPVAVSAKPPTPEEAGTQPQRENKERPAVRVDVAGAQPVEDDVEVARGREKAIIDAVTSASASRLNIERDDTTGSVVYKFVDKATGEIVRQIPDEELLERARTRRDNIEGVLVDATA